MEVMSSELLRVGVDKGVIRAEADGGGGGGGGADEREDLELVLGNGGGVSLMEESRRGVVRGLGGAIMGLGISICGGGGIGLLGGHGACIVGGLGICARGLKVEVSFSSSLRMEYLRSVDTSFFRLGGEGGL